MIERVNLEILDIDSDGSAVGKICKENVKNKYFIITKIINYG